jgi:hypothetical protein
MAPVSFVLPMSDTAGPQFCSLLVVGVRCRQRAYPVYLAAAQGQGKFGAGWMQLGAGPLLSGSAQFTCR